MQISSRIKEKIDIEENTQVIAYYEYLRSITELTELSYWIGNPSVQIISGKILLQPFEPIRTKQQPESFQLYLQEIIKTNKYKQERKIEQSNQEQQLGMNISLQNKISDTPSQTLIQSPTKNIPSPKKQMNSRCLVLCGIPNSKSPAQVMETSSICAMSHLITQIRVIKTVHIKYYGMLLLMKDQSCAGEFFNELFGAEYSDLQMERVVIREVSKISLSFSELSMEGGNNEMNLLRAINQQSQYISPQNIFMTFHYQNLKQKRLQTMQEGNSSSNQLVCAICFQECNRQAISILCGHYFDLQCLQKWSEQTCPLCRYHQQPPIIKFCEKCNQCEGLWVCLICGSRLCCGTNNDILGEDSHIYDHFKQTSHSLSMELETKFLFDAKIPAFLHQKFYRDLLRNRSQDDRLMEEKNMEENLKKDKITQQIQEYELQVAEQMKRQRLYFEDQVNQSLKMHRSILAKKRQQVEKLRSGIQAIDSQEKQTHNSTVQIEQLTEKKSKQLQILKHLIKMKEQQVQQKRKKISENQKLKYNRLRELQVQLRQKKEEILNYRKNIKLKQKWSEKLKGEEVQGEIIVGGEGKVVPKGKKGKKMET